MMPALEPPDIDYEHRRNIAIQEDWIAGMTYQQIAEKYDTSAMTANRIVRNATGERKDRISKVRRGGIAIPLDEFERADLRRMYKSKFYSGPRLAHLFNISIASVYKVIYEEDE